MLSPGSYTTSTSPRAGESIEAGRSREILAPTTGLRMMVLFPLRAFFKASTNIIAQHLFSVLSFLSYLWLSKELCSLSPPETSRAADAS